MNIQDARNLLTKPIEGMSLEQIQRHKVRLVDAWRESRAEHGFGQAVKDGFFKALASDSASGFVPTDLWLEHNLAERLDEAYAKEAEMLSNP